VIHLMDQPGTVPLRHLQDNSIGVSRVSIGP
jgi:hypothetical protein